MAEPERRENLAWVKTKLTGASPKSSARILTEDEGSRIINLLEEKKTSEDVKEEGEHPVHQRVQLDEALT